MYDTPDFYLVANPIERYSVGDRTPGLSHAEDGSLTIVDAARASRRTRPRGPTGSRRRRGAFRPILRMYEPGDAVFDGSYELPPIRRVG